MILASQPSLLSKEVVALSALLDKIYVDYPVHGWQTITYHHAERYSCSLSHQLHK